LQELLLLRRYKSVVLLFNESEITEFEWYFRDHLFRQSSRYRNSNSEKLSALTAIVVEMLLSVRVIERTMIDDDELLELATRLSRLQCSNRFYISYLSSNEPRKCLRCSSIELNDFPNSETFADNLTPS
jgi:hypothetical protein